MKQKITKIIQKLSGLPKKYKILAIVFVILTPLALMLMWQPTIRFSYQSRTCYDQFTLAPDIFKTTNFDGFRIEADKPIVLGNITIASRSVCVIPTGPPSPGSHKVVFAPYGWGFLGKTFHLEVSPHPVVSAEVLARPVPISKPLEVNLSAPDRIFSYQLKVDDKIQPCANKQQKISCDIEKLKLAQGKDYKVQVNRYFAEKKVGTVLDKKMTTLSAVGIKDTSIKAAEVLYAKPKNMQITLDKPIVNAKPALYRLEGDKRSEVSISSTVVNKTVIEVIWKDELARLADFQLVIDGVEATDGSSLVEPYVIPFKTSGGPKVTGINIGRTGVPVGSTVILTFDQPLSGGQDIGKVITASGGAVISGKEGNRVFISLAGVPKCGEFGLSITNELQNNHEVTGNTAWGHNARTVCHTVGTIGYSAKGRAINAYYFGSGPTAAIYTGAIHGSESSTRALMLRWIDELEAKASQIPAGKTVVVVPVINPDGIATGSRTNGNNVDLNRNFGTSDWKTDVTTVNNAPFPGGGGSAAMSEPETKAIAGLVSQLRPRVVLSYHSIGSVVAANQAGASGALASTYASLSGYGNVTGSSGSTFEYAISGTADDYYGEKFGVASILVELGSHSYHQFEKNQKAMWAMIQ